MLALQSAPSLPSSLRGSGQAFADSHWPAAAARHACATAKANALDLDPANANLTPSLRTALNKRRRTLAWIACGHSGHWRGSNSDRPWTVLGPRSLSSRPSTSAARRGRRRQWGDVAWPWHVSAADTFGSTQHRRPCSLLRLRRWHPVTLVSCPRLRSYTSQLSGATRALRRPGCCPTVLELVTSGLRLCLFTLRGRSRLPISGAQAAAH